MSDQPVILTTPEQIQKFHQLQLKYGMKLEMQGIRVARRSVFAYVKRTYQLHGSREAVYRAFCARFGLTDDPPASSPVAGAVPVATSHA